MGLWIGKGPGQSGLDCIQGDADFLVQPGAHRTVHRVLRHTYD